MGEASPEKWTEGGRPGRPPGLLGLAALKELPRLDPDLLRRLGLRRNGVLHQGLKLLLLALEAHRLGADLRWDTGEVLKEGLLEFLQKEENAKGLLDALPREERAFLGLADGASVGDLREVVEELYLSDHPRGVVQRLLRKLGPLLATLAPTGLGGLPLDRVPEAWAAATPLVGAFRGVFWLLQEAYGEEPEFQRALAPAWVFAFLRGEGWVADPFRTVGDYLKRKDGKVPGLQYSNKDSGDWCWVAEAGEGDGGRLYERPPYLQGRRRGPRVPSPVLRDFFPGWYDKLEKTHGAGLRKGGLFPQDGYDWDLVMEYRHALLGPLASSGEGGGA